MTAHLLLMLLVACGGCHDAGPAPAAPATPVGVQTAAPAAPSTPAPSTAGLTPPPSKKAAGCPGLSGDLTKAAAGATKGIPLDDAGRVQVTVETDGDVSWPASFVEEKSAMGRVQGWCPPADLCALAGTAGVVRVRRPHLASPK